MTAKYIIGNIFTTECQTIVNTVNCVGVMGAGIALECKLRHPGMYDKYRENCQLGKIKIGVLSLHRSSKPWILNFPTKIDWKHPSRTEYLHTGLQKFVDTYAEKEITSIAFPLLGADKGGLDKKLSESILRSYLDKLAIEVEIYEYDPKASDDFFKTIKNWLKSRGISEITRVTGIRKQYVALILDAVENPDICQVGQLAGVKGIGKGTIQKLFKSIELIDSSADCKTESDNPQASLFS